MSIRLIHGECLDVMRTLPDSSVNLIATDPPYYRVKGEAWDRQWESPAAFLDWIRRLCEEWQRILAPNGSLYVFASPRMAARVEVTIAERFNVINHVVWNKSGTGTAKGDGRHMQASKEALRGYFPNTERVIFAEHYGADNMAKGEAGYEAKCDELRGFVFEPLRAYLDGERRRAGIPHRAVIAHLGMTGHDSHFFSHVQWKLPLAEQYQAMRDLFNANGGDYLRREYDYLRREYDDLRREYDDLRREYDDLRRPFRVTPDVPYTDVWNFPTVAYYPGKHPCEKPVALMEHIVRTSSRPGDTVLDCFAGSGSTLVAAQNLGRHGIGIELNEDYIAHARRRLGQVALPLEQVAD